MSTVVADETVIAAGAGWYAEIHPNYIVVLADPGVEDALPAAVNELLSPSRQRFWVVEWTHEDEVGWDCYLIQPVTLSHRTVTSLS